MHSRVMLKILFLELRILNFMTYGHFSNQNFMTNLEQSFFSKSTTHFFLAKQIFMLIKMQKFLEKVFFGKLFPCAKFDLTSSYFAALERF